MIPPDVLPRLLAGPPPGDAPESLRAHLSRLGPLPEQAGGRHVIDTIEASGLLGRGGALYPVGRKWRSVADRADGDGRGAVVIVNGAEGEPGSAKDRTLMAHRPHLVLDGAEVAADAVGAGRIVVYVGSEHRAAIAGLRRAIAERVADDEPGSRAVDRSRSRRPAFELVEAPRGYVAGEQSAVVRFIQSGDARPTSSPPRPWERGVDGRPTLVQNVESLAHVALIARFGAAWYRSAGRGTTRGTALVTVSGAGRWPGVREIEIGTTVGEVLAGAGVSRQEVGAVLLGGYFGTWVPADVAWDLPLDPVSLRERGHAFGAGVVTVLSADDCGVVATARMMAFMAGESAAQCGPCVFGLSAIAAAAGRLADRSGDPHDLQRLTRWAEMVRGRGACAHPDGAVGLLASSFAAFPQEFALHERGGCSAAVETIRRDVGSRSEEASAVRRAPAGRSSAPVGAA